MGAKPRILVVEDESVMADVLQLAFTGNGWTVDVTTTAGEALEQFLAVPPDVVMTDKNLPDRSGVELVQEIRERDEAVGIVMITGYGTMESARDTLNLGVDEYLEKPFEDLFAVLDLVDRLRARVEDRRLPRVALDPGPLTVIVAAVEPQRRARIGAQLARTGDRVLYVSRTEELKPTARSERPDMIVLDGKAFPLEITALVAELKVRLAAVPCVVLSEALSLSDIKRLIQLEVKALIDHPLDTERFAVHFATAVDRVRRGRRLGRPGS